MTTVFARSAPGAKTYHTQECRYVDERHHYTSWHRIETENLKHCEECKRILRKIIDTPPSPVFDWSLDDSRLALDSSRPRA